MISWALEESLPATLLDQLTSQLHSRSCSPLLKTPLCTADGDVREARLDTMQRLRNRGEPDPASDLQTVKGLKSGGLWGPEYQEVYCKPICPKKGCKTKTATNVRISRQGTTGSSWPLRGRTGFSKGWETSLVVHCTLVSLETIYMYNKNGLSCIYIFVHTHTYIHICVWIITEEEETVNLRGA